MSTAVAPGGVVPLATTEVKVQTPAPAPAPAERSLQQPNDLGERAKSAKTYADIKAIIADGKKRVPLPPPEPSTEAPKAEAPQAPAEAPPTPPSEAVAQEAESETGPDNPPETPSEDGSQDEADDSDDEGESTVTPIPLTSKRAHLRLAESDKVGRLAASYMKRNKDMPMEEAIDKAKAQLGVATKAAQAEPEAPSNGLPKSMQETDAAIKQLRVERRKANTELRFEDATDYSEKLEDLIQHRSSLERQGERQQAEAVQGYERQFTSSTARAEEFYAFAADPASPGGKRMKEIDDAMEEMGDPLFHSADKPLRIAQMVAAEMNIAPRRKGAPPAPVKTAVPAAPKQNKQVLPSGSARTTPPAAPQQPAIETQARAMKSPHDFRKLMKQFK